MERLVTWFLLRVCEPIGKVLRTLKTYSLIKSVSVLKIASDDILVVTCTAPISEAGLRRLQNQIRAQIPEDIDVLVLDEHLSLEVVRKEK